MIFSVFVSYLATLSSCLLEIYRRSVIFAQKSDRNNYSVIIRRRLDLFRTGLPALRTLNF